MYIILRVRIAASRSQIERLRKTLQLRTSSIRCLRASCGTTRTSLLLLLLLSLNTRTTSIRIRALRMATRAALCARLRRNQPRQTRRILTIRLVRLRLIRLHADLMRQAQAGRARRRIPRRYRLVLRCRSQSRIGLRLILNETVLVERVARWEA